MTEQIIPPPGNESGICKMKVLDSVMTGKRYTSTKIYDKKHELYVSQDLSVKKKFKSGHPELPKVFPK